ncbi:hypothetical protein MSPP1_001073 [Malassezia sp. CBS 17886]|nr:hypothetical protein MSPP1_001073 [Malassezia sp. CBS 17886]
MATVLSARSGADEHRAAVATTYLGAHGLSAPSARYAYIFWIVLGALAVLLGVEHVLALTQRTPLGAFWTKWATAGRPLRGQAKARAATMVSARTQPARSRAYRAVRATLRRLFFITNLGRVTVLVLLLVLLAALTLIGADYIDPSRAVFDAQAAFPRRAEDERAGLSRGMQWGSHGFPAIGAQPPDHTLPYHDWWTSGSRVGDLASAMTPFVILLALKQVPFALFALPVFGAFSAEALGFLHRWGGRLLWVYATTHTIAWCIQLSRDRVDGAAMWHYVLAAPRFRWAIVAYIFLTLLVALSVAPMRRGHFELFYVSHIMCTIGFMVGTWAHYPPLGWWMLAGFLVWGLERGTRVLRMIYYNCAPRAKPGAWARGGRGAGWAPLHVAPSSTSLAPTEQTADMALEPLAPGAHGGKALGATPSDAGLPSSASLAPTEHTVDMGLEPLAPGAHGGKALGVAPSAAGLSAVSLLEPSTPRASPDARAAARPGSATAEDALAARGAWALQPPAPFRPVISRDLRVQLQPGQAFLQPLAGNMVRLVLRTARPLQWRPGQWLFLQLPQLSWFQSHPFTIASAYVKAKNDRFRLLDADAPMRAEDDQLIMLLIRARSGLTRRLWAHVQAQAAPPPPLVPHARRGAPPPALSVVQGTYMRALVDGPYGNSARIDWGAYASVVLFCGGSGIAFGISVLDYLCRKIARVLSGEDVRGRFGRPFLLRRVRFVWLMQEFVHLQWAGSAIRFCLELLPPEHLCVQIFATGVNTSTARAPAARSMPRPDVDLAAHITDDPALAGLDLDAAQLTQFAPDEDAQLTQGERRMNERIMREGQIRRAHTRRSVRRKPAPAPPPDRLEHGCAPLHVDRQAEADLEAEGGKAERAGGGGGRANRKRGQEGRRERRAAWDAADADLASGTPPAWDAAGADFASGTPPTWDAMDAGLASGTPPAWAAADAPSPADLRSYGDHTYPPPYLPRPDQRFAQEPRPASPRSGRASAPLPAFAPSPVYGTHPSSPSTSTLVDIPLAAGNLDPDEVQDFAVVAELTHAGYPRLDHILTEEAENAHGRTLTAGCGPPGLLALVRRIVARHVNLGRVLKGDARGHMNLYTESYE